MVCESVGRVYSIWLVAALCVATVSGSKSQLSSPSSFISYPLKPHHVVRRERRRQRHLIAEQDGVASELIDGEEPQRPDMGSVRRRAIAQQVGALYQGYGTHYIDLWCGSPPQRQTVIVDTGSGVTAFPCGKCEDCGVPKYHIDRLFKEEDSCSFNYAECNKSEGITCTTHRGVCHSENNRCKISMSYAEGSRWDAYESIDKCYVGGPHQKPIVKDNKGSEDIDPMHAKHFAFDMVFGCQTKVTGLFKTQLADGIMGMDMRKESYWSQMYKAGKMGDNKQFALCFSRQPTAARSGTESGALTLGGVDKRLHLSEMVYTTKSSGGPRDGFYNVKVRAAYIRDGSAGESAQSTHSNQSEGVVKLDIPYSKLNSGGVIVDSGTTDTYWNRAISVPFKKAFKEMAGKDYSHTAMTLSKEELEAMPTILFQLVTDEDANNHVDSDADKVVGLAGSLDPEHPRDIVLAVPPSHYMEYDEEDGKYTSRFYVTENGGSVLGANAIMGHDVLFDIDNDRIGWAESHCDYTHLVTENGFEWAIDPEGDLDDSTSGIKNACGEQRSDGQSKGSGIGDALHAFAESCDSMTCRVSVLAGFFMLVIIGCCLSRCFSSSSPSHDLGAAYRPVALKEVEMSDGFKDKPISNGKHKGGEFDGDFS